VTPAVETGDVEAPEADRRTGRPERFTPFQLLTHGLTQLLSHLILWATVEGLDQDLPRRGPLIVAINHASAVDPPFVTGYLAPALGRQVHWLAKRELFDDRLLGPIVRAYGAFPVNRDAADADAYRTARAVLDAGRVLGVSPEGTRSPDGALQPAKPGVALLAARTGVAILPVGIGDLDRFLPRHAKVPRLFRRASLRIGAPFRVEVPVGAERRAALEQATTEIMVRIGALLPERQWGAYAPQIRERLAEGRSS
jgi:1-acyl-sn-glycerol-3-phosphate acyltransferase